MSIQLLNPEGLFTPESYAQVGVAKGSRMVFISGQVASGKDGKTVGVGDLAAQMEQALLNVAIALEAVGGTFDNVAKITLYVPNFSPEKMGPLVEGLQRVAKKKQIDPRRPTTLIGVQALASPELLVELDVTAVLE